MLRPLLTWLLLLNYLLVVGAGLVVSWPPEPLFSAIHPYVHSHECQRHSYLRLDCFERCNGDQAAAHRPVPTGTGLHYLAQLKGLDVYFAAAPVAVLAPQQRGARLLVATSRPSKVRAVGCFTANSGQWCAVRECCWLLLSRWYEGF